MERQLGDTIHVNYNLSFLKRAKDKKMEYLLNVYTVISRAGCSAFQLLKLMLELESGLC